MQTPWLIISRHIECAPDIWSLYEWSNWVTPACNLRRRFNTIFYLAFLDSEPAMSHDGTEVVNSTVSLFLFIYASPPSSYWKLVALSSRVYSPLPVRWNWRTGRKLHLYNMMLPKLKLLLHTYFVSLLYLLLFSK